MSLWRKITRTVWAAASENLLQPVGLHAQRPGRCQAAADAIFAKLNAVQYTRFPISRIPPQWNSRQMRLEDANACASWAPAYHRYLPDGFGPEAVCVDSDQRSA